MPVLTGLEGIVGTAGPKIGSAVGDMVGDSISPSPRTVEASQPAAQSATSSSEEASHSTSSSEEASHSTATETETNQGDASNQEREVDRPQEQHSADVVAKTDNPSSGRDADVQSSDSLISGAPVQHST